MRHRKLRSKLGMKTSHRKATLRNITRSLLKHQRIKISTARAKEVRRNFPGYVFSAVIPRSVPLAEAPSFGKTILQYSPYSSGSYAYRELAQEIINLDKKI